jgi:hypothetical protein
VADFTLAIAPTAEAQVVSCTKQQSPDSESVAFLGELLRDGLQRHETLSRTAANTIIDAIENSIRCGFYLADLKSLIPPGRFTNWVEENFTCSYAWANQLRRLARHFCRDLADQKQREKLNIHVPGLSGAVGPHLRTQIAEAGCKSLNELFRTVGLLPAPVQHSSNGNASPELSLKLDLARLTPFVGRLQKRLDKLPPPQELSDTQRESLHTLLSPIVAYGLSLI